MRVGVYIDGFNLYYGGRGICGRSIAGWRWLDLRKLAENLLRDQSGWVNAAIADRKKRPVLTRPAWPIMIQNGSGNSAPDSIFMVSVARREEESSDVNVASSDGVGQHWWYQLKPSDFIAAQLPVQVGKSVRPVGW